MVSTRLTFAGDGAIDNIRYDISYDHNADRLEIKENGQVWWSVDGCLEKDLNITIEKGSLDEEIIESSPVSGYVLVRMEHANLNYRSDEVKCVLQQFIIRMVEKGEVDAEYRFKDNNSEIDNIITYNLDTCEFFDIRTQNPSRTVIVIKSDPDENDIKTTYTISLYEGDVQRVAFSENGVNKFEIYNPTSELSPEEIYPDIEDYDLDTESGRILARLNMAYSGLSFEGNCSFKAFFSELIRRIVLNESLEPTYLIEGFLVSIPGKFRHGSLPYTIPRFRAFNFTNFVTLLNKTD